MTTPDSQLQDRYGDLAKAADELLDAVNEGGPDDAGHTAVLEKIASKAPKFLVHVGRLDAHREDDDTSVITAESPAGNDIVRLCDDESPKLVALLEQEKAARIMVALVALGISARLNGLSKWKPPASASPDAAKLAKTD